MCCATTSAADWPMRHHRRSINCPSGSERYYRRRRIEEGASDGTGDSAHGEAHRIMIGTYAGSFPSGSRRERPSSQRSLGRRRYAKWSPPPPTAAARRRRLRVEIDLRNAKPTTRPRRIRWRRSRLLVAARGGGKPNRSRSAALAATAQKVMRTTSDRGVVDEAMPRMAAGEQRH